MSKRAPQKTATDPPKKAPSARGAKRLRVTNPRAAGIDIHSQVHWVAVPPECAAAPPPGHPPNVPANVRSFGACTADLHQLVDWLTACRIRTVAMESTGVYWIPLFELLEARGFEVYLVDPRQSRHAPGRPKSDVLDCQWLQRLHSYGLLSASFRPPEQVIVLRSYLRQRQMLLPYAGQHIQHMQKALEQMNVKLAEVVSDITGVTGMTIIKAILAGERDPNTLAEARHVMCKRTRAEIARALQGSWRAEHLFALKQAVELYEFYWQKVRACDTELESQLRTFADRTEGQEVPPRVKGQSPTRNPNAPTFTGVREALFRMSGVDLTVLEGINENTALVILSEVGPDVSRFPSAKHFASWLGLSPLHRGSAGKVRSRGVRPGTNRVGLALRVAVQGCHHAKNALGAFYRRIQARSGAPKAIVATARKLAERVYRLLRYGEAYVRQDMEAYEAAYRARVVKGLTRRASELGYRLEPVAPASV
jgi:transposase